MASLVAWPDELPDDLTPHFLEPDADWQAKNGQLLYRGKKNNVDRRSAGAIFEAGDFELTFTKGPGIALLEVRQDANFASVKGPLARGSWSGRPRARRRDCAAGCELRELLLASGDKTSFDIPPAPKLSFSGFDLRWLKRERRGCRHDSMSCRSSLHRPSRHAARVRWSGPRSR